ncbi:hypothetical protein GCM10010228_06970 [Streptomyces massasporeus]|nr:hypothetical protein GCM10010228_06970 [Streptomyces massasporeus]
MKNTFSAYVRLSQTRTRETMQAAFHGSRAGLSSPCPGRKMEGHQTAPVKGKFVAVVLGQIIRLRRALSCNARVKEFSGHGAGPLLHPVARM